jgi:hypothetical protein
MFIPDQNFFHPGSMSKRFPDPGSESVSPSKNLSTGILFFMLAEILIQNIHPGSGS